MDDERLRDLESRLGALERRLSDLESDYAADDARARRARAFNMWFRIGLYVSALALMLLFLLLWRGRLWF